MTSEFSSFRHQFSNNLSSESLVIFLAFIFWSSDHYTWQKRDAGFLLHTADFSTEVSAQISSFGRFCQFFCQISRILPHESISKRPIHQSQVADSLTWYVQLRFRFVWPHDRWPAPPLFYYHVSSFCYPIWRIVELENTWIKE